MIFFYSYPKLCYLLDEVSFYGPSSTWRAGGHVIFSFCLQVVSVNSLEHIQIYLSPEAHCA